LKEEATWRCWLGDRLILFKAIWQFSSLQWKS
jgi:hypothetical protein